MASEAMGEGVQNPPAANTPAADVTACSPAELTSANPLITGLEESQVKAPSGPDNIVVLQYDQYGGTWNLNAKEGTQGPVNGSLHPMQPLPTPDQVAADVNNAFAVVEAAIPR
jgi:hypothetical protein